MRGFLMSSKIAHGVLFLKRSLIQKKRRRKKGIIKKHALTAQIVFFVPRVSRKKRTEKKNDCFR